MNEIMPLPPGFPAVASWQKAPWTSADYQALAQATAKLDNPGLAASLSNLIGIPIEQALATLPQGMVKPVTRLTREALNKALDAALLTMPKGPVAKPAPKSIHKLLAGVSGAVGGSFGIASLAIELPVSATLMLRAIAATAHECGEPLDEAATKLACLEVFALGGSTNKDDNGEIGYYAVRAFLSRTMEESAKHLMKKGLAKEGAPALVRFVNAVAQRFSVQVSQKFAAQALPAIGAVSGATVNVMFMSHFQEMADAHFTIRRLERIYGKERVKNLYKQLIASNRSASDQMQ